MTKFLSQTVCVKCGAPVIEVRTSDGNFYYDCPAKEEMVELVLGPDAKPLPKHVCKSELQDV